jgi:hypothetical protein
MTARYPAPRPAAAEAWLTPKALSHVLVIAGAFCAAVGAVVLVGFGGWEYYRAPLGTRGYLPMHAMLRPSGPVGLTLGISGALAMLATIPYAIRKRWRPLAKLGTMKGWLELHIFFGIVGPVLVTLHTSFKFNGLISAGYWLMMTVWASGFVGRYLYVRIPKTMRGVEVSRREVDERLQALRERLLDARLPDAARREVEAFEATTAAGDGVPGTLDLFLGELRARVRLAVLRRRLQAAGVNVRLLHECISLAAERTTLARRAAHLQRTHRLFELWHVFHRPLVYGMFLIVGLHIAIALYFGYARLFL